MAAGVARRVSRSDGFAIFTHRRSVNCAVCNVSFKEDVGQYSLGVSQCTQLWMNYKILSHAYLDKICGNCRIISRDKLLTCVNLKAQQIDNSRLGKRALKNMESVLNAMTSEYRDQASQEPDHSKCRICIDTIDNAECDKLTKLTLAQHTDIGMSIMNVMKKEEYYISGCFLEIDKAHKDDEQMKAIEWVKESEDTNSPGNNNNNNSGPYLLRKIRKFLFYFYTKSVTTNNFEIMGIYHKRVEKTVRTWFHRGRALLYYFWMPYHNGFQHVIAMDIDRHRTKYTRTLEQILKKKIFCCVDGHEQRQDRYVDFNASYLSFSYKKYNTRKWMGFALYVQSFYFCLHQLTYWLHSCTQSEWIHCRYAW